MKKTLFSFEHVNKDSSVTTIYRNDSYYATVLEDKGSGFVLKMELPNGETERAYIFGSFSVGDRLLVSVSYIYDDGRLPKVTLDSTVSYATDAYYSDEQTDLAA